MRKTLKALLIVGSVGAMCAGLAACSNATKIDEYFKDGNVIMVTYDGSGGEILSSSQVSIVDMFNPNKYTPDSDGYIRIKLRDPVTRPGSIGNMTVLRGGYSLIGWYQNREVIRDEEGDAIDDAGNKLVERDGIFYSERTGSDGKVIEEEAVPAYTFSEPWDFATNRVEYKVGDEKLEMTLYAAWVPLFAFDYYHQVENEETKQKEWTKFATTTFDYMTAKDSDRSDPKKLIDSVFIPDWSETSGKMEHRYSNFYTFPSLEKKTFKAAYSDKACTEQITLDKPYRHTGSLDFNKVSSNDRQAKDVYVVFDEGSRYRVKTAQQFADIADPDGYYTLLSSELDFNCKLNEESGELTFPADSIRWPVGLTMATFTGRIESEDGTAVTFKNVGAQYSNSGAELCGLFGAIGKDAVIKNITFENVIFDIKSATSNRGSNIGMFAGTIDDKATVENVTVGGQMRLWTVSIWGDFKFNLIANGNRAGVTKTKIKLIVCGAKRTDTQFYFNSIDPAQTTVDADGNISFEAPKSSDRLKDKQYYTVYGGDENE